jgi:hypothetical protein
MVAVSALTACAGADPAPRATAFLPSSAPPSPPPATEPVAATVDLAAASDEFEDPASLAKWTVLQGDIVSGPEHRYDIGKSTQGQLAIETAHSTWVRNRRGFYMYQQIQGDFSVTVLVRAVGRTTAEPTVDWSLTGLLMRAPRASTVEPENWIGYTTGRVNQPVTETKTTQGSRSVLRLTNTEPGWVELRVVRVQHLFVLMRRPFQGKEWTIDAAYTRPDLPATLQVGIDALSGGEGDRADLLAEAAWIRFKPHGLPPQSIEPTLAGVPKSTTMENKLALSDADVAKLRTAWGPQLTA